MATKKGPWKFEKGTKEDRGTFILSLEGPDRKFDWKKQIVTMDRDFGRALVDYLNRSGWTGPALEVQAVPEPLQATVHGVQGPGYLKATEGAVHCDVCKGFHVPGEVRDAEHSKAEAGPPDSFLEGVKATAEARARDRLARGLPTCGHVREDGLGICASGPEELAHQRTIPPGIGGEREKINHHGHPFKPIRTL